MAHSTTIYTLIESSKAESKTNIQIMQHNIATSNIRDLLPYENKALLAMISKIDELLSD